MKLRRVIAAGRLELQSEGPDGSWAPQTDASALGGAVFAPDWELANAQRHQDLSGNVLPFQPASFRDFMVFEKHAVAAARGLVSRFMPAAAPVASAFEKLSKTTFPPFKPKPLFYRQPIYYMSNHLSFVPSGTPVAFPSYSEALDYELEIGFVLRTPLFDATPQEALEAIGAFVVVNDLSARDVQRAEMVTGLGPQKAKHFASSMSAVAVTADEILPHIDDLAGTVAINGRTVSTVSSSGPQWGIGDMLAHASRSEKLYPGELFATGTLPGGSGMETGNWLRPGDELTLTVDRIGEITHTITQ
ncbi:fumarylacetoacetate hydrolase family protein [Mycobacterium sp. 236(2023)]|uniref:fumarylacetoacetate hydrolase family protein n=1 Tax=Mycobacterium sp. 236(2023) TaxID=3038163 RepID=UPI002414DAC0|nr:fumarylacetoacetate hydrolase family protein [Mycobacterium sp. 236(2023)]MDG4666174.1 fumarylacetoacetate hydrolase family protein [Mycobacterium sp. 236(2023)]